MSTKNLYQDYVLNTYTRVGPVFVKGKGSWLWDNKGKRYLDLFPGWGVSILGHAYPQITKTINQQAKELIHLPNNLFSGEQASLAKKIVDLSFPAKVFFANSGAEAVEGAIKISRIFGAGKKYEVITMENSFHGRTFGALSATGQKKYKVAFKPLLPGFRQAKFNNFKSFKENVTPKTAAVMLELIQGEGGVNVADKSYIKKVKNFCKKKNILFIVDEVQTGMGRTGKLFCFEHYGITPDIMILSKGLGAGVPISAIVVSKKIANIIKPGMHASTFGGSPLVSKVSLEVFKIIKKEKLLDNAQNKGKYLYKKLNQLKKDYSFIRKVKGIGLMVALELKCNSYPVFLKCLEGGLIINSTHEKMLRIMPSLCVSEAELDKGLSILEKIFKSLKEK